MQLSKRKLFILSAATLAAVCSAPVLADQNYPSRPITIVVAYPAGGDADQMARLFGEKLRQRLGQTVVVENRAGASGIIGSSYVARAKPDGYTLLLAPSTFAIATHVINTGGEAAYHPTNDFTSIIQTASQPLMLVASKQSGFDTIEQLLKAARSNDTLTYASPGAGSPMHVLGELFNKAAGTKISHVPYKGVAPAVQDVMGGHVPLTWMTYGPVEPYIKSGQMKVLVNADDERTPLAPDAPSMKEAGITGSNVVAWQALFGPKGMPEDVVSKLNKTMQEVLKEQDVIDKMRIYGAFPKFGTPAELTQLVAHEHEYFGKVIKEFGITAQ